MDQNDQFLYQTFPDDPRSPWISLLVLQPSPFCNINCDYCYLPNRKSKKRMSMQVIAATIEKVFAAELVFGPLTMIWHAGEPLVLPISYYEQAFEDQEARSSRCCGPPLHAIQWKASQRSVVQLH
jgi:sulfatase maturation enzyme AslB (radical SAM superfamily)